MIKINHLTKNYGALTAVNDITFHVPKGEILAFLGPNGAGKTTTMRILTGFIPPSSGTVEIAGHDILMEPHEVKKRIGYLPESPPLYNELTVTEYLEFASKIKGVEKKYRPSALKRALESCALTGVHHRLIGNLSRGYRQRVGLAQALIHNPDVIILDEPTIGLDPKQIIEMRSVIKELAGQHTVILSTHILSEATAICQRVIIINEGQIIAIDSPERLSAQLRRSEKIHLVLQTPSLDTGEIIKSIPGVLSIFQESSTEGDSFMVESELGHDLRTELAGKAVQHQWGLLELRTVTLSLEDVFLKLIQDESPANPPEKIDRPMASSG